MSVLIRGMEMPESCHDCRFCGWSNFWQAYDCHMTKNNALLLINGEKTNSDSKTRNGRADNCPLIPVPPHGDLIERDKLCDIMFIGEQCLYSWDEIEDAIDYVPTIIPAEEGEG